MSGKKTDGLSKRLLGYGIAAAAVGGATVADAEIEVYDNGGDGWTVTTDETFLGFGREGSVTYLDNFIDADTFLLRNDSFKIYRRLHRVGTNNLMPQRLDSGVTVGPDQGWLTNDQSYMSLSYSGVGLNGWSVPGSGYAGLKFGDGAGTVNYGWAEISLSASGSDQTLTLERYAIETTQDTAILTGATIPEPSTLGILALGAVGLAAWRRRQKMVDCD